ncbi:Uncharacterized conserved protein [Phaffia rhodozyma]|uniref:Uncharacterized conserved protein n=1 Tax=Phaffia rhodozyma TaxID=264483 RepID=A0A0F7SNI3_PHARH|nr:Uncharacterized conserved protein [Phaffia rhodozyma]
MASNKPSLPVTQRQPPPPGAPQPRGPNRSTKASQKLKVLPDEPETLPPQPTKVFKAEKPPTGEEGDDDDESESEDDDLDEDDDDGVQVYKQLAQIPAGSARRDAMRLTRKEKARLPRVTAYCVATSYRLPAVFEHLKSRRATHDTNPVQFDEAIYTSYTVPAPPSSSPSNASTRGGSNLNPANHHHGSSSNTGRLIDIEEETSSANGENSQTDGPPGETSSKEETDQRKKKRKSRFAVDSEYSGDEQAPNKQFGQDGQGRVTKADVFVFEYGTVVIWGMTQEQEKRFISSLKRYEVERLSPDDIEMEDLNFYYANYSRIYNDVIALRKGSSYMTKLSLSHALAQSVKLSFFEGAVSNTIEETKDIPQNISETGKIKMPRKEIMKQIGRLFLLRVNISLVGSSFVDSPELFWTFPDLEPLYSAGVFYLEVPQRLKVINGRVDVLQDMLRLLKESVNSAHGEGLERIVIWLIVLEIILGLTTIMVDLFV